jgi:hypothetical protein
MVTKKTTESCPEFAGNVDVYLAEIGGEAWQPKWASGR